MKKVIFGSALLIGGILLTTLSSLRLGGGVEGIITSFPFIGMFLFFVGIYLGIKGLGEND